MTQASKRPLSPHLQVYRPQLTSILSILHRITGFALFAGTLLMTWWLMAAAAGPESFAKFHSMFIDCWIGKFMLFGWTWSLCFHLLNGIRHLIWDMGKDLDIKSVYRGGWAVMIISILLTAAVWSPQLQSLIK